MGVFGFAQDYVPHPWSGKFLEEITTWSIIIGGFGLFIGIYSLLHMHVSRIRRRTAGWGYSIFVFIGAAAMLVAGLVNEGNGPLADVPKVGGWFNWGYLYIYVPCQATIFSILAFFMATAAFRTFRAKNFGAALLLIAAIIVMFGRVPISETFCTWLGGHVSNSLFGHGNVFARVVDAIMENPNLAAKRGILLGLSLGAISQSLRIVFGIERSYLGGD
jgi:hypothetical protein